MSPHPSKALSLSVFDFSSAQEFLHAYFGARKGASAQWSHGVWARQLGIKSPSTLIMILKGQRRISSKLGAVLSAYFEFDAGEAEYFEGLVRLQTVADPGPLARALRERIRLRGSGRQSRHVDERTFLKISGWQHYALQQLAEIGLLPMPAETLARGFRFPVSASEITQSIQRLVDAGMLKRALAGKLVAGRAHLTTSQDVQSEALRRFHRGILDLARASLDSIAPTEREISGVTFAMPISQLPRAKELIREFEKNLCELMEAENGADSVVHLEVALIPLFETPKESRP